MISAIIPAAGRGTRMLPMTENCPKCLLPVNGKPLLYHQINQLISNNLKDIWIVVNYNKDKIIDYVNLVFGDKANFYFVEQKDLNGLSGALDVALDDIDLNKFNSVFIYLSDILVFDDSIFNFDESYIAYKDVDDYSRWCLLDTNDSNEVICFNDKPDIEPDTKHAIIGAYYFSNIRLLRDSIKTILKDNIKIKDEFQLSSALELYLHEDSISGLEVKSWFDFGELDTYNKSCKEFNSARFFNNISFNDNSITKTSSNYHKIQKEICWFLSAPKKYIPKLLDFSLRDSNVYYKLDYVDGVNLRDVWSYFNIGQEKWEKIFRHIKEILDYYESESSSSKVKNSDIFKFINNNLEARLYNIENKDVLNILNNNIVINNKKYISFSELRHTVLAMLNEIRYNKSNIIHGDMVFSNIIYNEATNSLTLIDPRGDFNGDIIYGDTRYDLAKIYQCLYGNYDLIKGDLFSLNFNNNSYNYKFYNENNIDIDKLIKIVLNDKPLKDIKLITAFQFITMIPLHKDEPNHQIMMALIATKLFNECVYEWQE